MKSEWRTSTVLALCQAMRETQDFSACPILADALMDAGCCDSGKMRDDNERCLSILRTSQDYVTLCSLVAQVLDEKAVTSIEWIENFIRVVVEESRYADDEPGDYKWIDYPRIMKAAKDHMDVEGATFCFPFVHTIGTKDMAEFWKHYAVVTGAKVPEGKDDSFFRCAC